MSNSYFRFKQFEIQQENCAMKVTTDACIQGAWTPIFPEVTKILDIGTGTGLLALMLAQRQSSVKIDAVEIDPAAAKQANENIIQSPWQDRIKIIEGDIGTVSLPNKYDLIITNPPFFTNSLLGPNKEKNLARHTHLLSTEDLYKTMEEYLSEYGYFSILLPTIEFNLFDTFMCGKVWNCFHQLQIKHTSTAPVNRIVGLFKKGIQAPPIVETLEIYERENVYSERFSELLQPFYIKL